MKSAVIAVCLLLVVLQAIIDITATPVPVRCSDVAPGELCSSNATDQRRATNCNEEHCKSKGFVNAGDDTAGNRCPNCSKDTLTVQEAFNKADFVVRGKVLTTSLMGANHVLVEAMVQLVMKSRRAIMITPGKLSLVIRLDRNWMCNCPGASDIEVDNTYLITGFVRHAHTNRNAYELRINQNSIIKPWKENIVDDMDKNKEAVYHGLKFIPKLTLYRIYYANS